METPSLDGLMAQAIHDPGNFNELMVVSRARGQRDMIFGACAMELLRVLRKASAIHEHTCDSRMGEPCDCLKGEAEALIRKLEQESALKRK